jgi:hypothetical protein
MAAWAIGIDRYATDQDLLGERIGLRVGVEFYFTNEELTENEVLIPFSDDTEIDRLMLPENYDEWRNAVLAMAASVMLGGVIEAMDINGERFDLTRVNHDDGPATES